MTIIRLPWLWLSSNGLPVLAIINIALFLCVILLAFQNYVLFRRIHRIALAGEMNTNRINELANAGNVSPNEQDARVFDKDMQSEEELQSYRNALAEIRSDFDVLRQEVMSMKAEFREHAARSYSDTRVVEFPVLIREEIESIRAELVQERTDSSQPPAGK